MNPTSPTQQADTASAPAAVAEASRAARARATWTESEDRMRERLEGPVDKAKRIGSRVTRWAPVRMWRHFLRHDGFLLAAGLSYQALFAFFAALYIAFAGVAVWLGGSSAAINGLIDLINGYIPGLIIEAGESGGILTREQVEAIASDSQNVLTTTGLVALGVLIWVAIGFVTFARRGVRAIFGLPFDDRGYIRLKARDLLAAVVFGGALVIGGLLGFAGTWLLRLLFDAIGWNADSTIFSIGASLAAAVFSISINSLALAGLYRFLAGTALPWRTTVPGALLAGLGLGVLQLGANVFVVYSPSNPLLVTFAVFIFLLLWFRIAGIVILVGAAIIAVRAQDEGVTDRMLSEEERAHAEHTALVVAGHVRLRERQRELAEAPWWRRPSKRRAVQRARNAVERIESEGPEEDGPRL